MISSSAAWMVLLAGSHGSRCARRLMGCLTWPGPAGALGRARHSPAAPVVHACCPAYPAPKICCRSLCSHCCSWPTCTVSQRNRTA